jgi:hypothetical protein
MINSFIYLLLTEMFSIQYIFILFQLSQVLMFRNHLPELLTHFSFIIIILLIIFIGNYAGQEVINHHNYLFINLLETLLNVIISKYLLYYIIFLAKDTVDVDYKNIYV